MGAKKTEEDILKKLGIEKLNPMQVAAKEAILSESEILLLSPTGTGKTLAFLLPIIAKLNPDLRKIQALIIVPSRELAIQIEQVIREMGSGYKANAFYGGRSGSKDKFDLNHPPAILVGTPGRIASHMYRETFDLAEIKTLVLDEFDKSLEIGFDDEMIEILEALPAVEKKILTSATYGVDIPDFAEFESPKEVNFLTEEKAQLEIKLIESPTKNKDDTLIRMISNMGNQPGIIFCNFKETIAEVSDLLHEHQISHGCFHGGMEQRDRERALIQFRNGTHQLLVATDLASRGIDIPDLKFILHFQLPHRAEEFTHRNGRTARMHAAGTAYVLKSKTEQWPDFIPNSDLVEFAKSELPQPSKWKTLFISGGRKDKISKGDLAGLFFKQGKLGKTELGIIELKTDCAFVAVAADKVDDAIRLCNNTRLKKKKVRVSLI
ncbi:MAG: DEAD/DEAH box helicase [Crocinitomix sp.]|nr:DEAD/DEAH box helicase [Crocinitomix sp.]